MSESAGHGSGPAGPWGAPVEAAVPPSGDGGVNPSAPYPPAQYPPAQYPPVDYPAVEYPTVAQAPGGPAGGFEPYPSTQWSAERHGVGEQAPPMEPLPPHLAPDHVLRPGDPAVPMAEAPPSRRSLRLRRKQATTPLQAVVAGVTEIVVVLGMALGLSLLIKTFLVQAFFIPSQSMENTLLIGDRVLVSKLSPGVFGLSRGDVVVFRDPGQWLEVRPTPVETGARRTLREVLTFVGLLPQDSGEHLIKRVIGLPGDTVVCCDARGRLQVNGTSIDEPYLPPGTKPSADAFTVTVKPNNLWVMGDNRDHSSDSRAHRYVNDGQVPLDNVVGRAFVTVWPLDRLGRVGSSGDAFAHVPEPSRSP